MGERGRCGNCGRTRPETVRVGGRAGGSYRRGSRHYMRRVCRECTEKHVAYVRERQAANSHVPLSTSHFDWESAAKQFDMPVDDLWTSKWTSHNGNIATVETRYSDGRRVVETVIRN